MKSVFAASSLFALVAVSAGPALADDFKSLPEGPGRDVTVRVCSSCHSPEVVSMQTLDAAGWKNLVGQMMDNGAKATDDEADVITKYLTAAFPNK